MSTRWKLFAAAFALALTLLSPPLLKAEDVVENAGVGVGVSIGNILFLPIKAIAMTMGVLSAGFSYAVTGNADLTKQIWQDTTQGPYVITPELARTAIGQRPELLEKK
jgi:hypothetical protein